MDDTHFYVTNDHFYRAGGYRLLEDFGQDNFGAWSDLIYVSIDGSDASSAAARKDGIAGVTAVVALADLQNPNGLAHGRTKDEVILGRAASGIMHTLSPKSASSLLKGDLNITSTILLGSCMDNPSYFHDPYPNHGARDASGFVVAGLAAGVSWPAAKAKGGANPNVVWLVQPPLAAAEPGKERKGTRTARKDAPMAEWTHTRIWADDGRLLDSASTAVIVPIKPDEGTAPGEKEAWLFVTGPVSEAVVRTKIYL